MPTTAPNDDRPDSSREAAERRMNDIQAEVLVLPPDTNPVLPFMSWPVPPDMTNTTLPDGKS